MITIEQLLLGKTNLSENAPAPTDDLQVMMFDTHDGGGGLCFNGFASGINKWINCN